MRTQATAAGGAASRPPGFANTDRAGVRCVESTLDSVAPIEALVAWLLCLLFRGGSRAVPRVPRTVSPMSEQRAVLSVEDVSGKRLSFPEVVEAVFVGRRSAEGLTVSVLPVEDGPDAR